MTAGVYLVSGFLGSGKTTLLRHLLNHVIAGGGKPGVLMNEFGDVDVDGELAAEGGGVAALEKVLSGCLCCTAGPGLGPRMNALLDALPAGPLFVETTGLADAAKALDQVRRAIGPRGGAPARGEILRSIAVVDPRRFRELPELWRPGLSSLKAADTVLVNKMDLCDDATVESVEALIHEAAPHAAVLRATRASVPPEALLGPAPSRVGTAWFQTLGPVDSTEGFESVSLPVDGPVDIVSLQEFLEALDKSVVRAKGIVQAGWPDGDGLWTVHWSGGTFESRPFTGDGNPAPRLVLIVKSEDVRRVSEEYKGAFQ